MINGNRRKIALTHLNIRQSISILLTKLILSDIMYALLIVGFYFSLQRGEQLAFFSVSNTPVFIASFIIFSFLKILIDVYVVLLWLNEYYELTGEYIVHRSGVIFQKKEEYRLSNIREIKVTDSFLGELFNFGTITVFDIRLNKYLDMYLIHNHRRYANILQELKPRLEIIRERTNLPFLPKEKDFTDIP